MKPITNNHIIKTESGKAVFEWQIIAFLNCNCMKFMKAFMCKENKKQNQCKQTNYPVSIGSCLATFT